MAQAGVQLHRKSFSCSICLELLKEPVTVPCSPLLQDVYQQLLGWREGEGCVQLPPVQGDVHTQACSDKSTMLAELVQELRKNRLQDDPPVLSYAGAEDVACDVCTGRKLKAFKSCLTCVASYCEKHLQRHNEVTPSKRHKLVDPSKKLQENICSHHDEVMKMFCRTDQQCICFLCSTEEHKGHDTVSAAAERTEKQRELQESRADISKNIQDREKDLQLLEEQLKSIQLSADHTVQHSQQIITELIHLLQKRSSELEKEVRCKQQTEVSAVRALQKNLEQEISDLKKRDAELQQITTIEDHIQFVLSYSSLSALSVSTHTSIILTGPQSCFQELTEHLHSILMEDWTKVFGTVETVKDLQLPEPTSRAGFLQYSQGITLDPNTAHSRLSLSEGNRKVTHTFQDQHHSDHPDRFTGWEQVLSRESLTGRCYCEMEVGGNIGVSVAYKSISRAGIKHECGFGLNDKSWMLLCSPGVIYTFFHNNIITAVRGLWSSRIGVYVNHTAGTLSFYSVCDTMTLLHRVHTTFTEPLHMGIRICPSFFGGETAEICKP